MSERWPIVGIGPQHRQTEADLSLTLRFLPRRAYILQGIMIGREISNRRRVILFCRRSQQFGKERLRDFAYQHSYPSRMDPVTRPAAQNGYGTFVPSF
jgi:hypothetical protein